MYMYLLIFCKENTEKINHKFIKLISLTSWWEQDNPFTILSIQNAKLDLKGQKSKLLTRM